MTDYYWEQLRESRYYNPTEDIVRADVHLKKDWMSENLKRYRGATYTHRTGTDMTIDMFKLEGDHDFSEQLVLVQEFTHHRDGKPTLMKEYILECEQANLLYKNLLKRGFYRR